MRDGAETLDIVSRISPDSTSGSTVALQVAVFARNEGAALGRCLAALGDAALRDGAWVTVILNGCTDGSADLAPRAMAAAGLRGEVWGIPRADKANAINQYVHRLRRPATVHLFVDGYAAVAADAPDRLVTRLPG